MLALGTSAASRFFAVPPNPALFRCPQKLCARWRAVQSGAACRSAAAATPVRAMSSSQEQDQDASLVSVEFEVFGVVQGVFFRAYTTDKARQLGLVGYCQNLPRGTVKGEIQGPPRAVENMKDWLCTTGSPHSVIERCEFSNERSIPALEYANFATRRR